MAFAVADSEQGAVSEPACSSSSPAGRATPESNASSPTCWPTNAAALACSADAGFELSHERESGEVELGSRSRRRATARPVSRSAITPPSSPRCGRSSAATTVAVIGASRRRGSIGGELFRNILAADFAGAAYPRQP